MNNKKAYIYYENTFAGVLEETENEYLFTYDLGYLSNAKARPVSLTLPLRAEPYKNELLFSFFDGLIPEGWYLRESQTITHLEDANRFELLLRLCRDTIGAVSVSDTKWWNDVYIATKR